MNKKDTLEYLNSLKGVQFTHEDTLNEITKGLLSGRHKRNEINPSEWIFEIKGYECSNRCQRRKILK